MNLGRDVGFWPLSFSFNMRVRQILHSIKQFIAGRPPALDRHLITGAQQAATFRDWNYFSEKWSGTPRILMAAGHGYGNLGDEAQCGACIERWRQVAPKCRITIFSPNPAYSEALHEEKCEWAPRVAWFRANTIGPYFDGDGKRFEWFFFWLKLRLMISAHLIKRGLPVLFCNPREARVLQVLQDHDLLHISGGGFLTGKTRSRLWENCLLMRICQILDIPYILTGHNIGVFQNPADRKVARMGLQGARYIGLRDRGISERELAEAGISGSHIESTCDDALLCHRVSHDEVAQWVANAGLDASKPWVAVNFHHWGQSETARPAIESRFAEICDELYENEGLQVLFISMTPSDTEPEQKVIAKMKKPAALLPYSPNYRVVRGVIADASLVFTMKHHPIVFAQGEGVPVVSVALDPYYYLKNKGALDNTGHAEFVSNESDFMGNPVLEQIRRALGNSQEISRQMNEWSEYMRQRMLLPYQHASDRILAGGRANRPLEMSNTHVSANKGGILA